MRGSGGIHFIRAMSEVAVSESFVSVPTMIRGRFRLVENSACPSLLSSSSYAPSTAMQDLLGQSRHAGDPVLRVLAEMDRKLDAIITLLQRESLYQDFPMEGRIVELGAEGLVLECSESLPQGTHMELLLLPGDFTWSAMSVFAEILIINQERGKTAPDAKSYELGYTCLNNENKDAIIRFIFSEERKRIREQKASAADEANK
ncbi:hypothetical protein LJC59_06955 [Desulfovibrio sp. OttesenSCG-928-A18]|nr:hypothetical protein [Desulfovibrio sp. OttesenSCG-928-A18]